jgi:hypothetical protein
VAAEIGVISFGLYCSPRGNGVLRHRSKRRAPPGSPPSRSGGIRTRRRERGGVWRLVPAMQEGEARKDLYSLISWWKPNGTQAYAGISKGRRTASLVPRTRTLGFRAVQSQIIFYLLRNNWRSLTPHLSPVSSVRQLVPKLFPTCARYWLRHGPG